MRSPSIRLAIVLATGAIAAAGAVVLAVRYPVAAPLVIPTLITAWLINAIHHGYLSIRELRWRRRRQFEARQIRGLAIPESVPNPSAFAGVAIIDSRLRAALPAIPDRQASLYARGVIIAAMPSVIVLVAAFQTITAGSAGTLGAGLSIANVAMLITLIVLVWGSRNPSHSWVLARTRAELLRREIYLCQAAVGPYQDLTPESTIATARERVTMIGDASAPELNSLVPLHAGDPPTSWHDMLWLRPAPPLPDLADRAQSYLHYRIRKQLLWFTRNRDYHRRIEGRITTIARAALLTAVLAIIGQTALQLTHHDHASVATGVSVLAFVLPPVCTFLLATQGLYSFRRLSASYHDIIGQLEEHRTSLSRIIEAPETDAVSRRFQSIVIQAEAALTNELQRWRLITERDEHELPI